MSTHLTLGPALDIDCFAHFFFVFVLFCFAPGDRLSGRVRSRVWTSRWVGGWAGVRRSIVGGDGPRDLTRRFDTYTTTEKNGEFGGLVGVVQKNTARKEKKKTKKKQ